MTYNIYIAGLVCVLSASSINAATNFSEKVEKPRMTLAERQERMLKNTGGYVERPDSLKGRIVFLNRQTTISDEELKKVFGRFKLDITYNFILEPAAGKPGDVTIEIVDEKDKPAFLAAPYSRWALVNVAKLKEGLLNENAIQKFLPERTRKLMMKAFCYAAGAGGSQYPNNVMANLSIKELDYVEERLPYDTVRQAQINLASFGITPVKTATYIRACREGWAPAPTNDIQKTIWEKVHKVPEKPLKITYDKAAQKPVVK